MQTTRAVPNVTRSLALVLAVAMGLMLTLAPTASAETAAPMPVEPGPSVEDCDPLTPVSDRDAAMTAATGAEATAADRTAATAIDRGEIATFAPGDAIAFDSPRVYAIDAGDASFTSVTYPIAGEYTEPSNLTVVLDDTGQVVQYAEALVVAGEGDSLDLRSYVDGQLVLDDQTSTSELTAGADRLTVSNDAGGFDATTQSGTNTAGCLAAVLGVSTAVAATIAFFCKGACVAAFTPPTAAVCAACIAGFATVGGASIPAVASCFN